tara:strand:+ start:3040 stop:3648 length:609 start_codon:yes stop_codon:yes gene_type:complete
MGFNETIGWIQNKGIIPGTKKFGSNEKQDEKFSHIQKLRMWDPFENTLSAGIMSGLEIIPINDTTNILYIGKISKNNQLNLLDLVKNKQKNFIFNKDFKSENIQMNNFEQINNLEQIIGKLFSIIYIDDDMISINDTIKILNEFLNKSGYVIIVLSRLSKNKFNDSFNKLSEHYRIVQEVNIENYFPKKSLIIFSAKKYSEI